MNAAVTGRKLTEMSKPFFSPITGVVYAEHRDSEFMNALSGFCSVPYHIARTLLKIAYIQGFSITTAE